MRNVIEMQEIEITEDGEQTVDIWDNFGESKNLKEAKKTAKKLATEIRNHTCPAVFEIADRTIPLGSWLHNTTVIDIDMIPPEEWN